jgi:hypothetical protein
VQGADLGGPEHCDVGPGGDITCAGCRVLEPPR